MMKRGYRFKMHIVKMFLGLKCKVLKHKTQTTQCPVTGITLVKCYQCKPVKSKSSMSFN